MLVVVGAVLIALGALVLLRRAAGPSASGAAGPRRASGAATMGETIAIEADVYDIPFATSPDEEVSAVLGSAESSGSRVVRAEERGAFLDQVRALRDSGRITALSAPRIAVLPNQPAGISITSRPAATPTGKPAREELSLAIDAAWAADGSVLLDAAFRFERVVGRVATVLDEVGLPVGERARAAVKTRLAPGELVVLTRLVGDSRYVVVLGADKTPGK